MRDRLLGSRVIHCDETRVKVMKEPDREPTSQSWMWVQTGGPPNQPVILFDYSTSQAQEVPSRLLEGYRGYLMTDDYSGYNALGAQSGVERLGCWPHARRKFVGKNWLFSDTPKGATASAQLYSLVETAKANGQEPYAWLRHALERMPLATSVEDYEALLPWNCSPLSPS